MINKKIKYFTFVTKDTPYEDIAKEYFQKTLSDLGLSWELRYTENLGSWTMNVAEKPLVIKEALEQCAKDECLVAVDADAEFVKKPELFHSIPTQYDIAFHLLEWRTWYNRPNDKTKELLTGTMFFRRNKKVFDLLDHWHKEATRSKMWEQKVLQKILDSHNMMWYNLPIEYWYINSLPSGGKPHVKCDAVIIHHQVSRQMKRIIGR